MSSPSSTAASSAPPPAPIQPIAATLPPELLMLIFEHVQPHYDWFPLQAERLRLGLVCRSWYAARIYRDFYFAHLRAQGAALLKAFEANPAKAAQVQKIDLNATEDLIVPLIRCCTNAVEIRIHNEVDLAPEVLDALPASVRKLKLFVGAEKKADWVPELSRVNAQVKLDLCFWWHTRQTADTSRAVAAIEPVLGRISHFTFNHYASQEDSTKRGYLEPHVAKMTSVKKLDLRLWQVRADRLPELIAQLDALDELRILGLEEPDAEQDGMTPAQVKELIKSAPAGLRSLVLGERVLYAESSEADWTVDKRKELAKLAHQRNINLEYIDDGFDYADFDSEISFDDEFDSDEGETASSADEDEVDEE